MLTVFPWQVAQWQQLQLAIRNDRLPHALLLEGPEGIGIRHFSDCLANNILCSSPDNHQACGHCKACHLFDAGSHPDLRKINPDDEGKQIKIDQIRELIEFITLKSQYQNYKIVIIKPAEAMNRNAANTLLKTLEEPPAQSLIILLTHRKNLLPITIRSRCQTIRFKPTFDEAAVNWIKTQPEGSEQAENLLSLANGAPLAALKLMKNNTIENKKFVLNDLEDIRKEACDPVDIAIKWDRLGATQVLLWLLQTVSEIVRLKFVAQPMMRLDENTIMRLQQLANELDLRELMVCYDLVLRNYNMQTGPVSYNSQGLLEDFIIYWQQLSKIVRKI